MVLKMRVRKSTPTRISSSSGFTLIEVMISMLVLTIGLVGVLSMFSYSVSTMQLAQQDLIAKQKAREALESIYGARNTSQLTFASIQNVSNTGVFLDGLQPLCAETAAGNPDGIIGTADDNGVETMTFPGPDGIYGTADDVTLQLTNFKRQIAITKVLNADGSTNPDLRKIAVTVQYTTGNFGLRQYTVTSYISRFR